MAAFVVGLVVAQTFAWMIAEEATAGNVPWSRPWSHLDSTQVYDIVRSDIAAVALIGAGGAALIAYRRQVVAEAQQRTAESQHDLESRRHSLAEGADLRQRYSTAAEQLGHTSPAVRLAGVYAMAQLADEWSQRNDSHQLQVCIDVLCAYLRIPSETKSAQEGQVRRTILRVIADHVTSAEGPGPWSQARFDFQDAEMEEARFEGAYFEGPVTFVGAKFIRYASFAHATFSKDALFTEAEFDADLVDFESARFAGRTLFASANFNQSGASFKKTVFDGGSVDFQRVDARHAIIGFDGTVLREVELNFHGALLPQIASDHVLYFSECDVDSSSAVDMRGIAEGIPGWTGDLPSWLLLPAEGTPEATAEPSTVSTTTPTGPPG